MLRHLPGLSPSWPSHSLCSGLTGLLLNPVQSCLRSQSKLVLFLEAHQAWVSFFFISSYRMELLPLRWYSPPVTVDSRVGFFFFYWVHLPWEAKGPVRGGLFPFPHVTASTAEKRSPASSLRTLKLWKRNKVQARGAKWQDMARGSCSSPLLAHIGSLCSFKDQGSFNTQFWISGFSC